MWMRTGLISSESSMAARTMKRPCSKRNETTRLTTRSGQRWPLLVVNRVVSFLFEQGRFIVLAAIEDSDDINPVLIHMECDRDALSIAGHAEARANVIAPVSTGREGTQALAVRHNAVGKTCSDLRGCLRSNVPV